VTRGAVVQPGAAPDMQMILQQAQKMQQELMSAQAEIAETEVTGQAGGDLVSITVTGAGEVRSVRIDPKVVDRDDVETLQDLVAGAVADAYRAVQELTQEKMGPLAGALGGGGGLGLPGM
jgi:nucleoid-associated protein EbfC